MKLNHWKFNQEVWVWLEADRSDGIADKWHYINACADDGSDILFGSGGGIDPKHITRLLLERPTSNLCPHCLEAAQKDRRLFLAEFAKAGG